MNLSNTQNLELWKSIYPLFSELMDLPLANAKHSVEQSKDLTVEQKTMLIKLLENVEYRKTLFDGGELVNQKLSQMTDLTGTELGEYKLLKLISKGGMSEIYLAERKEESIQKKTAIKVLPKWLQSKASLDLFHNEQLVLSKLRHPNIIQLHHGGISENGTCYIVMDYIENAVSLDHYVYDKNLSKRDIVKLAITIIEAISLAHSKLVIHGDLKASNIVLDANDHLYVLDFGISFINNATKASRANAYTPEIASPEQIKGDSITASTDIFSLAATILGLITKKKVLPEFDPDTYDPDFDEKRINEVLSQSNLDKDLQSVFSMALQINPANRYNSISSFSYDLKNWLQHKPVTSRNYNPWQTTQLFVKRNPSLTLLASLLLFTLFFANYRINLSNQQLQHEVSRTQKSLQLLDALMDQASSFETGTKSDEIKALITNVIEENNEDIQNDPYVKHFIYQKLAKVYDHNGLVSDAIDASLIANEALKKQQSVNPESLHDELLSLSELYLRTDQVDPAIVIVNEAKTIYELNDFQTSERDLALLIHQFKIAKAEKRIEDAINFLQQAQVIIQKHEQDLAVETVGEAYNTFANFAAFEMDLDTAEQFFISSIEANSKSNDSTRLLPTVLTNAAIFYGRDRKDYVKSEKYFKQAIKILKDVSPQHPKLGSIYAQYAQLLSFTNRIHDGINVLQQAIPLIEGSGNLRMASVTIKRLGAFHSQTNQFVSAHKWLSKALMNRLYLYGTEHELTLSIIELMVVMGMVSGATDLTIEHIKNVTESSGKENWYVALMNLIDQYQNGTVGSIELTESDYFELIKTAVVAKNALNNIDLNNMSELKAVFTEIDIDLFNQYQNAGFQCTDQIDLLSEPSLLLKDLLNELCQNNDSTTLDFKSHMEFFEKEKVSLINYLKFVLVDN